MKKTITQSRLKELLSYDKKTGIFVWKESRCSVKKGNAANTLLSNGKYIILSLDGSQYLAHRLAWLYEYGHFPENQIDHINHIGLDNRIINIREVTHQENHKNRPMQKNNTSGIVGVREYSYGGYGAHIKVGGVSIHLGSFKRIEDAKQARIKAERIYGFHKNHGEDRQLVKI